MQKLHVVLSCTNRKRRPSDPALHLRAVEKGADRVGRWIDAVRASPHDVAAEDLYAGEFWTEGRALREAAGAAFEVEGWVISAGLGLINTRDTVCSYQATFNSGRVDSIVVSGPTAPVASDQRRTWWVGLGQSSGRASGPRSLAAVAALDPQAVMVVCAGPHYLEAVRDDLRAAQALLGGESLLIFASSSPGSSLDDSWIRVPGRLRLSLGGSMSSTSVRACGEAMTSAPGSALCVTAAREVVGRVVRRAPAIPPTDRKKLDDDELISWIRDRLARDPAVAKSVALRDLRDSGRACEQGRFGHLFEKALAP